MFVISNANNILNKNTFNLLKLGKNAFSDSQNHFSKNSLSFIIPNFLSIFISNNTNFTTENNFNLVGLYFFLYIVAIMLIKTLIKTILI